MLLIIFNGCFSKKESADNAAQDNNSNFKQTIQEASQTAERAALSVSETDVISALTESSSEQSKINDNQPAKLSVIKNFITIPGGIFQIGNKEGDHDEIPVHHVTVNSFYIGKYEVTQKEYAAIIGKNPSGFKSDAFPVESISWYDAIEYCNKLSEIEGLQPAYHGEGENITCNFKASGYRLPTEAEWEYAAGGKKNLKYAGDNDADTIAWYNDNSSGMTHAVGTKKANGFGIFDMSGNVAEWCWDVYGTYSGESQNNPTGASEGKTRVVRGGFFGNNEWNLRITARNNHTPIMRNSSVGFRIVRSAL
jgi:formylglycine-generating enzyme required for sulfatase activity